MERLRRTERKGLRKNQLLFWGLLFMLAGMISRSYIQKGYLQMGSLSSIQLMELMSASSSAMAAATAALVLQALETCALPIFAFLLTEGFEKTKNRKTMALCLLATAVVSEIPYNFAMHGKFLDTTTRNPAVGLLIGFAVLYFFRYYGENSAKNTFIKVFVGFASILWAGMLKIDHGVALLVMVMTLWALRNKKPMNALFCAVAAAVCSLISPFYIVSAMGVLPVHLYKEDEEQDQKNMPVFMYAVYPILLLTVGILSNFI